MFYIVRIIEKAQSWKRTEVAKCPKKHCVVLKNTGHPCLLLGSKLPLNAFNPLARSYIKPITTSTCAL